MQEEKCSCYQLYKSKTKAKRLLNGSRLHFNPYGKLLFIKNIREFTNNLISIANSTFSDSSSLELSKLIECGKDNDLANIKNQRFTDQSTIITGHLSINFFRSKY